MATLVNPLDLTRNLLAFNTINPPGQERDCAKYLSGLLESVGFQVSHYEFAPQSSAGRGSGGCFEQTGSTHDYSGSSEGGERSPSLMFYWTY